MIGRPFCVPRPMHQSHGSQQRSPVPGLSHAQPLPPKACHGDAPSCCTGSCNNVVPVCPPEKQVANGGGRGGSWSTYASKQNKPPAGETTSPTNRVATTVGTDRTENTRKQKKRSQRTGSNGFHRALQCTTSEVFRDETCARTRGNRLKLHPANPATPRLVGLDVSTPTICVSGTYTYRLHLNKTWPQ